VYVETADPPIAGGRWFVLPGEKVIYQRPNGEHEHKAMVTAHTLTSSPSWKIDPDT
jgi:hypothetical protein